MATMSKVPALSVGALLAATSATAHTTSLGYVPGATAGSVVIWAGHYDHGDYPPPLEGTGTLTGVSLV